ncbi:aminotransferase class I/II-fold pyridoxal phosphate-dependent enzyme [Clostridiaceae bacterium M8S5]|nr:aminotransferase class I/II-fold pyridoxal phosphate-dependent enzyme [Clostridiaceae bacterium M8S5]
MENSYGKFQKMIFFSPHYDDFALSNGGLLSLLKNKMKIKLVNVFTLSNWSVIKNKKNEDWKQISKMRKHEDDKFCEKNGIEKIDLGYMDSSLRGYNDETELIKKEEDESLIKSIRNDIKSILECDDYDLIFAPLAIGNHVDHIVIHDIINSINVKNVIYYEDIPYICGFDNNEIIKFVEEKKLNLSRFSVNIDKVMHEKIHNILLYKSQLEINWLDLLLKYSENSNDYKYCERIWINEKMKIIIERVQVMLKEYELNREKEEWPEWPVFNNKTIKSVLDVFQNKRWAISGYYTNKKSKEREFSEKFAEFNDVPYCVPTTNGSSALVVALEALDIGYGDEVIVPALTWLATATAVLNVNAKPVLVDVNPETYCIDVDKIESLITAKTKAIIPVHLFGCVADMDKIIELSKKHKLKVIEDCAQSHGSVWNGKKVGSIGDLGTFSFQQGKVLTAGEGGAVITKDYNLYKKLQQLRADSRVYTEKNIDYGDMEIIPKGSIQGSNYCMSEFQASILLEQLSLLDNQNKLREKNAKYLDGEIKKINGLKTLKRLLKIEAQTYYGYVIKIDRDYVSSISSEEICIKLRDKLQLGNFYIHPPYTPIHSNKLFCPWTKCRYDKIIVGDEKYWKSQIHKISESAQYDLIIIHHSMLLASRNKLNTLIDALKDIMSCTERR